jgi:hypothetical protein
VDGTGKMRVTLAQAAILATEMAIGSQMQGFGVNRQTAMPWIRAVLELLSNQDQIINRLADRPS